MTLEEFNREFGKETRIILTPRRKSFTYKRIKLEPKYDKQYFIVVGFNGEELRYFHLGDNSFYTGFSKRVTDATILEDGLYEILKQCIMEEAQCEQICVLARMPIKMGQ